MRKAIFVKFIQVILAALILSSAIFYIAASSAPMMEATMPDAESSSGNRMPAS